MQSNGLFAMSEVSSLGGGAHRVLAFLLHLSISSALWCSAVLAALPAILPAACSPFPFSVSSPFFSLSSRVPGTKVGSSPFLSARKKKFGELKHHCISTSTAAASGVSSHCPPAASAPRCVRRRSSARRPPPPWQP
jgi:hypothetical protein